MRLRTFIFLLAALLACGCIHNDIPVKEIDGAITLVEAVGATAKIDPLERRVTLLLDERCDICNVEITKVEFNDATVVPSVELKGVHDLKNPLRVTLKTGIEKIWTIAAEQEITRYFTISGQIGAAFIDDVNHRVVLKVNGSMDRKALDILSIKLGPEGLASYSPDPSTIHDFSNGAEIEVTCHGRRENWTIYVEKSETVVEFLSIEPWTCVAWLKASAIAGAENGFRYRKRGEQEWIEVPDVLHEEGEFSAALDSLQPLTEYECMAYCGEEQTAVESFTTEEARQLPNGGFETFSHAESDKYFSFYDPASSQEQLRSKWWGSGNKGSTTVGSSYTITMPDTEVFAEGKASIRMESRYVVIKFAAGNVFSGEYSRTIGTSGGVVRFGRPFTQRPRKLTFMVKYKCGKISEKTLGEFPEGDVVKVGDNDRAAVWIALGTWDYKKYGGNAESPIEINTTDKASFFNPDGPDVVAYGRFLTAESIDEWTRIEIPLEYRNKFVQPTHIIVSCAASLLGDYFTGSDESVLWVDDFRLEY